MDREHKNRKYEDYITAVTRQAAAAGRREPYHLTYLKKYGERGLPGRNAAEKIWERRQGRMVRIICDRCGKEIPAAGRAGFLSWNFRDGYRGGLMQTNALEGMDYCETCMKTIFDFIISGPQDPDGSEGSSAEGPDAAETADPGEKEGVCGKPAGSSIPEKKTGMCREKARMPRKNSIDMGKVMALRNAGWSYGKIADEMGMSKQSVCNAISRWRKAHGTEGQMKG